MNRILWLIIVSERVNGVISCAKLYPLFMLDYRNLSKTTSTINTTSNEREVLRLDRSEDADNQREAGKPVSYIIFEEWRSVPCKLLPEFPHPSCKDLLSAWKQDGFEHPLSKSLRSKYNSKFVRVFGSLVPNKWSASWSPSVHCPAGRSPPFSMKRLKSFSRSSTSLISLSACCPSGKTSEIGERDISEPLSSTWMRLCLILW